MSADLAAGLAEFLTRTLAAPTRVDGLEYLSAGARRRNVGFTAHVERVRARKLVATLVPAAVQIMSVEDEAAVRELARTHGVAVPAVVAVCADPAVVGEPFVISDHVAGETVPRKVLRLVAAAGNAETVAREWGEAMGRLHAIDPAAAARTVPSAGADPAAAVLAAAEADVRVLLGDRPVFALALRWLEHRLPGPPPRTALLHTDLRNGNIVTSISTDSAGGR